MQIKNNKLLYMHKYHSSKLPIRFENYFTNLSILLVHKYSTTRNQQQGRRQKNFQEGATKKRPKNSKKYPKL